jgi:hypothetical protein
MRLVLCLTLWLTNLWPGPVAWAQTAPARESTLKAAYLYKFAGYVEWPPNTFQRAGQPLVIGVSGDEAIAADLTQLVAGRTIDDRPVVVRRVADGEAITGIQVLFVAARREARLREILASITGPVLVVTESVGALRMGSVINFSSEGGRVRFSASIESAQARNIKLSARLLAVAQFVEDRAR